MLSLDYWGAELEITAHLNLVITETHCSASGQLFLELVFDKQHRLQIEAKRDMNQHIIILTKAPLSFS